jgi:DNA-binding response OmpR family regulator
MKILIVEDEALIALGVQTTLTEGGHDVIGIADDLPKARGLAEREKPDMAFIDIKLANNSDGVEVARELSALGITCVFATGNPPDPERVRGLGLGYIVKPFPHRLLLQTVAFVARVLVGGNCPPRGFVPFRRTGA